MNLASADFRHSHHGCASMARYWQEAANVEDVSPGARAYAFQQSAMYASIAAQCKTAYDNVRRVGTDGEQLDHSLVSHLTSRLPRNQLTWSYSRCSLASSKSYQTSNRTTRYLRFSESLRPPPLHPSPSPCPPPPRQRPCSLVRPPLCLPRLRPPSLCTRRWVRLPRPLC